MKIFVLTILLIYFSVLTYFIKYCVDTIIETKDNNENFILDLFGAILVCVTWPLILIVAMLIGLYYQLFGD